ncbi:MAG: NHL repeat-containing protein [Candidatus Marinimicrobia bacterium]|nr:NHL repeat-containing protein [Candidatus Neomarinimicrobiota bacterium]
MASTNVILLFNNQFGSRGSGSDEFNYPSGICIANNKIYQVDKQNNRVKIHNLNGNYVSSFGTYGSGNTNFSFPEFIISDGVHLFITDSANHRIKKHDLNGVYVAQFGTRGSGNDQFDYPMAITIYNDLLYIADKQNGRAKVHQKDGTYISEIGGFNFLEGITNINDKIVISDSGNKKVKYYTALLNFLFDANTTFSYPTSVKEINGVLCVTERQDSMIVFLDDLGNKLSEIGSKGSGQDQFFFPYDSFFNNDFLYISDSANHRIKIFDITIEQDVPIYADELLEQTKQLYPTGRAWWMKKNSIFEKVHLGLAYSESRALSAIRELLDSIIPDNDNFDDVDAFRWERALGLFQQPSISLDDRKAAILRKMQYPGSVPARQHYLFVQGELQKAGFNVYVHENRFGDPPSVLNLGASLYGQVKYGQATYGAGGVTGTRIANHIEESKDAAFNFGSTVNLRATFFIGGKIFPNRANVHIERKSEFRELILRLKPAQTAGSLLIDYGTFEGIGFDEIGVNMEVY